MNWTVTPMVRLLKNAEHLVFLAFGGACRRQREPDAQRTCFLKYELVLQGTKLLDTNLNCVAGFYESSWLHEPAHTRRSSGHANGTCSNGSSASKMNNQLFDVPYHVRCICVLSDLSIDLCDKSKAVWISYYGWRDDVRPQRSKRVK